MEVFVDDRPMDAEAVRQETLADTLRHVQSLVCEPDRLVVRLRCDGHDVLSDAMDATLRKRPSSVSRLEVFTTTRKALVNDAMNQAFASLQETEEVCQRVAELLTEGKTREGMESLGDCLRVWQQIHSAVTKSIEMLQMDVERLTIQGEAMVDVIAKPKEVLLQVRDALTCQDHVLLADLLQYEFKDVTDQWYSIIARVREESEGK